MQENSIYLVINAGAAVNPFPWGVLINGHIPDSWLWQPSSFTASFRNTTFIYESATLLTAYRLGRVDASVLPNLQEILDALAVGPGMDSHAWTIAAVHALDVPGGLHLTMSFADIESAAVGEAMAASWSVERGTTNARVINATGASDGV